MTTKFVIKSHRNLGDYYWYYHCGTCNQWGSWWASWWKVADRVQLHWDAYHK